MNFSGIVGQICCFVIVQLCLSGGFVCPSFADDKNGVSPNTISLPSGPGSITGLGESFQPMLNTGTAKYNVTIALPSGTAGHTPRLTLTYEGGFGVGPAGIGWKFGPGSVSRQTDKGIPLYVDGPNENDDDHDGEIDEPDELDRFIGIEGEELVQLTDGTFRARIEGTFIRYRRVGEKWEAHLKDGTKLELGASSAARITDSTGELIFRWLLEKSTDTNGNVIEFSYGKHAGSDNQKYLQEIRYGPGSGPWGTFYFVYLIYEERPDWRKDYGSGFLIKTNRRLARIDIGIQGILPDKCAQGDWNKDGIADALIRRYVLSYVETQDNLSLLGKVTQYGSDGVNYLPPISFSYSVFNPESTVSAADAIITSVNAPTTVMDSQLAELVDLNRDSLPDLLKTDFSGGNHTCYFNLGMKTSDGRREIDWDNGHTVTSPDGLAQLLHLVDKQVNLADMDGNGISDLIHTTYSGDVFYHLNQGDGSWGARKRMSIQDTAPPPPFSTGNVRTSDLDFDKRMDVVRSTSTGYSVWFNLKEGMYSQEVRTAGAKYQGNVILFSQKAVHLADINGDRLNDVAWIRPNRVIYCAGMGYGHFDTAVEIAIPDVILTDYEDGQVEKAQLQDVNGDGLADLVLERAQVGQLWYWLNRGTDRFSGKHVITGMPTVFGANAVTRWADINGNGTTDLIYADSTAESRLMATDIGTLVGGSIHPNLLTGIDNGLGVSTKITYRCSTEFYCESRDAGKPWSTAIPFPVSVVDQVTTATGLDVDTVPGIDKYVKQYAYRDGFYEDKEKAFRGFAEVRVTEIGDETAPTRVTTHHFFTGGPDSVDNDGDGATDEVTSENHREEDALKGLVRSLEVRSEDGFLFSKDQNDWRVRNLAVSSDDIEVRFAYNRQTDKLIYEGTDTPETLRTTFVQDDFGNVIEEKNFGALSIDGDEAFSFTTYINDTNLWIIGLPQRSQVTDADGQVFSESLSYYDGPDYTGLAIGQLTRGNLTRQQGWVADDRYVNEVRNKFDEHGNIVGILDPNGNRREVVYDLQLHVFPEKEIIEVGGGKPDLIVTAAYNIGLGVVTSSWDFNGHQTRYGHDTFSRLTSIVKPGDSQAFPTFTFAYTMTDPAKGWIYKYDDEGTLTLTNDQPVPSSVQTRTREQYGQSGTFDTVEYVDGLGRKLASIGEGEEGFIVTDAVLFNAAGTVRFSFMPYTATADKYARPPPSNPSIEAQYDAVGRSVLQINPHDAENVVYSSTQKYLPLKKIETDENGSRKTFVTDGLDRLLEVHENNQGETYITRYAYNPTGNLTRIIDANNNVTLIDYDGLQRKTDMNHPDRGVIRYAYDDASNVIETIDAKNQRITYTYDAANRLLTEDYHDKGSPSSANRTPDVVYHYDTGAGTINLGDTTKGIAANTKGKLSWVEDLSGEEHISYDELGRIVWTVKRISDPLTGVLASYKTEMKYDSLGRVIELIYPDNDRVHFMYNASSLLEDISGGPSGHIIVDIDYRPTGQLKRCEYGNGIVTEYGYDSRQRLTSIYTAKPSQSTNPLLSYQYFLDGVSNITHIDDLRAKAALPAYDKVHNTQIFSYDDLYRLITVRYPNIGAISYSYDRIGNMLSKTSNIVHQENGLSVTNLGVMKYGGASGPADRVGRNGGDPPGPHAVTSTNNGAEKRVYSYDDTGNMTQIDGMSLTWDFKDRLVAVENNAMRAEYTYDHTDRRIVKKVTSKGAVGSRAPPKATSTLYINRYFEVREHDQPVKYVFNNETRVARIISSLEQSSLRVQRLKVFEGWNLLSLAVHANNAAAQLGIGTNPDIKEAYRWDAVKKTYIPIGPQDSLSAGSVFWLLASAPSQLEVRGTYSRPLGKIIAAGDYFIQLPILEAVPLEYFLPSQIEHAWVFDASTRHWLGKIEGSPSFISGLPSFLQPGQAIYIRSSETAVLQAPNLLQTIRYYHQDHLGSSNIIADAEGSLLEEYSFYPFGHLSQHYNSDSNLLASASYLFSQKENDKESGLQYFDARYYSNYIGKFLSVDPIAVTTGRMDDPQHSNSYGYGRNNPILYIDPQGSDPFLNTFIRFETGVAKGAYQAGADVVTSAGQLLSKSFWENISINSFISGAKQYAAETYDLYRNIGTVGGLLRDSNAEEIGGAFGYAASNAAMDYYGGKFIGGATSKAFKKFRGYIKAPKKGGLNLYKWADKTSTRATGWKEGDRFLHLPDKGSFKANWKQNAGRLREEMNKGNPIYDSYRNPETGIQIKAGQTPNSSGRFLNAERQLLESRGWRYNPQSGAYYPPGN